MIKVLKSTLTLILVVFLLFLGIRVLNPQVEDASKQTIYFYNWGDYIDPDIIRQFEAETGYRVVYETFDSNEAMIGKVDQGATAYDLVVPSEYAVEIMGNRGLLKELDHSKIEGLDNIDPLFLDQAYDPGNQYSIPYFWGTFGIIYDQTQYSEEDLAHWRDLWDPQFENSILIYDGARETFGMGMLANGYSLNTKDPEILEAVQADLVPLMANVKAILADEIKMYMVQGEAPVAVTFSGEAAAALSENEDLAYHVPEEGSNIWFDTLVIPRTSQNEEGAYALINYLLRPEIAAQNAEYIEYSTPNKEALALLDEDIQNNERLYPGPELIGRLETFEDLGPEMTRIYNDLYLEWKMTPRQKR